MAHVGQEIRRLREEKGWSQAKLGVLSGTGPSGISQIETGRRNPSAATLMHIAEALDVEVGDLFPKDQVSLLDPDQERRSSILAKAIAVAAERWAGIVARGPSTERASGISLVAGDLISLLGEVMDTEELWEKLSSQERSEIAGVIAALRGVTQQHRAQLEEERAAEQRREMVRQWTHEFSKSA